MDAAARLEVIRELCSFEGRRAGTDAERRAANRLAMRLREGGRPAALEPTYVHPQFALALAAHCLLGLIGSLVAIVSAPVGFAIVLATAASLYLDVNARLYLVRRVFFRRASQNVVSPGAHPDAPAHLFLCANYDAARAGMFFRPRATRWLTRVARLSPVSLGPLRPVFWSLALLLPILGARMAGVDSNLVSFLQLVPTLILLVGVFLLVDVELSGVVPGANENASGVATALSLAEDLAVRPPENLDVGVLLTGGGECLMEGMRGFLRAHRRRLDPEITYFLNLDSVGRGEVRYVTGEGLAVSFPMDQRVIELCDAVASAERDRGDRLGAAPLAWGFATDAVPIRLAGFPCTTITTIERGALVPANHHRPEDVPERIDPDALDRAHRFALALVGALDREIGRRLRR